MTKQETYDTIVAHLRKQGCKSIKGDACLYRGPNGLMCAAGCLIPDDNYHNSIEGKGANVLNYLWEELGHNTSLVCRMQNVHDTCLVSQWEDAFMRVAKEYNLVYKPANI